MSFRTVVAMNRCWLMRSVLAALMVVLLTGCAWSGQPGGSAHQPATAPNTGLGETGPQPTEAPARPVLRTLLSSVQHSAEEARANISAAMVELIWDRAEPSVGQFDEGYLNEM